MKQNQTILNMFLDVFVCVIAVSLPLSQQCERNSTNTAIKSVISQLSELEHLLKNNVTSREDELPSFDVDAGRGHKDHGLLYLIPLFVGTKTAGLTAAAFTVIKLFIIQAFVFSKLALLSLSYLVLKKLLQYNSIHVHKMVSSPSSSFGLHDYMPGLQLDTAGTSTDPFHAQDPAHYSTILQSPDSQHQAFIGTAHQEDSTNGFTPSSEFTGLGAHASPDLQGQFSIASQSKVVRPSNDTNKADDRIFRTYPSLARRRVFYPAGVTHFSGALRQRLTH
nr:PREDICTED: uncharacterized protein LOC109030037 [Bemisia tabaci]